MAFKHYAGRPPAVHIAWKCPSCGAENIGALEDGCSAPGCGAGKDAKKVTAKPGYEQQATVVEALLPALDARTAYLMWIKTDIPLDHIADHEQLFKAFVAGAMWQREQAGPAGNGLTEVGGGTVHPSPALTHTGGYLLAMIPPGSNEPTLTDQRTHETILAALAFYRDNQLAYGAVPGHLTAMEVSALIEQLTPQEVPAS